MSNLTVIQNPTKEKKEQPVVVVMEPYDFSSMVLNGLLMESGYKSHASLTVEKALETIEKAKPSILFFEMDWMEEKDKKNLALVQEKYPNLPIAAIVHVRYEEREKIKEELKVQHIVQRPFSRKQLVAAVQSSLAS